MNPGESGKYWYITDEGKFVSTYAFEDYDPPSDTFQKYELRSAEIVDIATMRRPHKDMVALPKVA